MFDLVGRFQPFLSPISCNVICVNIGMFKMWYSLNWSEGAGLLLQLGRSKMKRFRYFLLSLLSLTLVATLIACGGSGGSSSGGGGSSFVGTYTGPFTVIITPSGTAPIKIPEPSQLLSIRMVLSSPTREVPFSLEALSPGTSSPQVPRRRV